MNKYPIEQVLPHDHPMILIDALLSYEQQKGVCEVTIKPTSAFYDDARQGVPSYIGVEYMAQAIAAFAGANALDEGGSVEIGYLLGSRKYQPNTAWFERGARLEISVERLYEEASGLRVFQCQIHQQDSLLVDAKINVFLPNQANQGNP